MTESEPHQIADRLIRDALRDPRNLADLVEAAAGEVARGFDFGRAEFDERGLDVPAVVRREADVVCRVPFRGGGSERPSLVCVHVEHQSRPEAGMPLRMLLYAALFWHRLWRERVRGSSRRGRRLPVIVPIVLHTGGTRWRANQQLADLLWAPRELQGHVPRWPILVWDLAEHSADSLLGAPSAWLQALAVVRAEHEEAPRYRRVLAAALRRVDALAEAGADDAAAQRGRLLEFILNWTAWRRPADERERLLGVIAAEVRPEHREEIEAMSRKLGETMEQRLVRVAKERYRSGREEGREEGGLRVCRALLRKLLRQRFGEIPGAVEARIESTNDVARLEACVERILEIESLDEFEL